MNLELVKRFDISVLARPHIEEMRLGILLFAELNLASFFTNIAQNAFLLEGH